MISDVSKRRFKIFTKPNFKVGKRTERKRGERRYCQRRKVIQANHEDKVVEKNCISLFSSKFSSIRLQLVKKIWLYNKYFNNDKQRHNSYYFSHVSENIMKKKNEKN